MKRAIKAVKKATGQPVAGVRFHTDGFTVVLIGEPIQQSNNNPWDEVFDDAKNQKRPS